MKEVLVEIGRGVAYAAFGLSFYFVLNNIGECSPPLEEQAEVELNAIAAGFEIGQREKIRTFLHQPASGDAKEMEIGEHQYFEQIEMIHLFESYSLIQRKDCEVILVVDFWQLTHLELGHPRCGTGPLSQRGR